MGIYIPIGIRILRNYVSDANSNFLMMLNTSCTGMASLIVSLLSAAILKYLGIDAVFIFLFIIILCALQMLHRVKVFD